MLPLLFILIIVAVCTFISYELTQDQVTWFTYFRGVVAGLFVSGVILEIWNARRKKKEEEEAKQIKRVEL
ncbi:MAG: hypothetical protein DRN37_04125 [Thermoplasmata archaeon]|nr:MAG: hypothetical protein DRN37_04125 [Thermoplasmata archaeon]